MKSLHHLMSKDKHNTAGKLTSQGSMHSEIISTPLHRQFNLVANTLKNGINNLGRLI